MTKYKIEVGRGKTCYDVPVLMWKVYDLDKSHSYYGATSLVSRRYRHDTGWKDEIMQLEEAIEEMFELIKPEPEDSLDFVADEVVKTSTIKYWEDLKEYGIESSGDEMKAYLLEKIEEMKPEMIRKYAEPKKEKVCEPIPDLKTLMERARKKKEKWTVRQADEFFRPICRF